MRVGGQGTCTADHSNYIMLGLTRLIAYMIGL